MFGNRLTAAVSILFCFPLQEMVDYIDYMIIDGQLLVNKPMMLVLAF